MNKVTKMVMAKIAEVDATNEGASLDLRLDVSCIIHAELAKKGWSQKTLADRAKMKPPLLTRIMHGDSNCTLESISRIFTALEIKGKIVIETHEPAPPIDVVASKSNGMQWKQRKNNRYRIH